MKTKYKLNDLNDIYQIREHKYHCLMSSWFPVDIVPSKSAPHFFYNISIYDSPVIKKTPSSSPSINIKY